MNKSFHSLIRTIATVSILASALVAAHSEDWNQFLGPNRNGVSAETGLARAWPKSGPEEIWSIDVGQGFGGASVAEDNAYILDRVDTGNEVLRCLNFSTGKERWNIGYKTKEVQLPFPGSRSTPTIDGDHVYTIGRVGNLYCFDTKTRKAVWNHDLMKKFGFEQTARWGYSQSPLVHGDLVIAAPLDDSKGYLVAFDKRSGKEVWRTKDIKGANYVSPKIYKFGGIEQVLMFGADKSNKTGTWTSVEPKSGKILWEYSGYFNNIMIPSPTPFADGKLFITGGYGAGSVMVQVTRNGSRFAVKELSRIDGEGSQIHPALLHGDHFYVNWNTNENLKKSKKHLGGLACVDFNGKVVWRTGEEPSFDRGNIMLADGMVIVLDGELGELVLVDPKPSGYRELARAKVFDKLKPRRNLIWAPMALSGGKLIVRSQNQMKCLDLRGSQAGGE